MQKYEDDLMYASEAIQKIASEAMQRVENLYKLRFSQPPRGPEPSDLTPTRKVSETPDISATETLQAPEKIGSSFDLVDNFMHNIPKSTKPTVKPNLKPVQPIQSVSTSIDQRPEKIDSNLHGLTL